MNKKGLFGEIILIILFVVFCFLIWNYGLKDKINQYSEYKTFCEDKPSFCYCEWGMCEFKTQWSSTDGLSQDTKDLCKLAKSFDDKKTMFAAGCEE